MLTAGLLEIVHEGVYRCAGAPLTFEQALIAACFAAGPGAVASHRSAAAHFGLWVPGDPPIEITVPRATSPFLDGVIVHRLTDLEPRWVTKVDRVPVTVPARIAVDAGAVLTPWHVGRLLDQITGRQLAGYGEVRTAMEAVARRGGPVWESSAPSWPSATASLSRTPCFRLAWRRSCAPRASRSPSSST